MDLTFKTAGTTIEAPRLSEFKENEVGAEESSDDMSDGKVEILSLLGIEEPLEALPDNVQDYVDEINDAIETLIEKRNLVPSKEVYDRLLNEIREDMGIDRNTDPTFMVEKIGKTLEAWEELSSVRDLEVKKSLFAKLAKATTSKEMDRLVLEALKDYE